MKRAIKDLTKLETERDERLAEANAQADRHVAQVSEAAADLVRICSDPDEAKQFFALVERPELEENEFNLNLPRYVDTFEPEAEISLAKAMEDVTATNKAMNNSLNTLNRLVASISK